MPAPVLSRCVRAFLAELFDILAQARLQRGPLGSPAPDGPRVAFRGPRDRNNVDKQEIRKSMREPAPGV